MRLEGAVGTILQITSKSSKIIEVFPISYIFESFRTSKIIEVFPTSYIFDSFRISCIFESFRSSKKTLKTIIL